MAIPPVTFIFSPVSVESPHEDFVMAQEVFQSEYKKRLPKSENLPITVEMARGTIQRRSGYV
jgi:hypothetical protein